MIVVITPGDIFGLFIFGVLVLYWLYMFVIVPWRQRLRKEK